MYTGYARDPKQREQALRPGDPLFVRKTAKGRFTLDTTSGRTRHLLLCTVTGIAPFLRYVRTLYRDWKEERFKGEHELFVIQGASRSWEFGYRTEMERIAKEVPWLTYVPHDQPPVGGHALDRRDGSRGRPHSEVCRPVVPAGD